MIHLKSLILLATLALATGESVTSTYSYPSLRDMEYEICKDFLSSLRPLDDVRRDGQKLFHYAKDYLEKHTKPFTMGRGVVKAWQAVAKEEDCSESSWKNVVLLNYCGGKELLTLRDQLKVYTARCLTPAYASKMIKEKSGGMFAANVEFINDAFIKKFYQDNPDDLKTHPLQLSGEAEYVYSRHCCKPEDSKGALVQAIEQDFEAKGKDPKKEFYAKRSKLETYLNRKLLKPCKDYIKKHYSLRTEIVAIANQYEGAQEAWFPTLDTEAKNFIFRFKYCELVVRGNTAINYAAQHFVQ